MPASKGLFKGCGKLFFVVVSTSPTHGHHPKLEGRRLTGLPLRLQGVGTPKIQMWFNLEPNNTKQQHLNMYLNLLLSAIIRKI